MIVKKVKIKKRGRWKERRKATKLEKENIKNKKASKQASKQERKKEKLNERMN